MNFGFSELALAHFLATEATVWNLGGQITADPLFWAIRSSATYFIHVFYITWVMPDAGDPEMDKAQGSQSKWGESVNEDVITVWLRVAARARTWWTQESEVIFSVERHQLRR